MCGRQEKGAALRKPSSALGARISAGDPTPRGQLLAPEAGTVGAAQGAEPGARLGILATLGSCLTLPPGPLPLLQRNLLNSSRSPAPSVGGTGRDSGMRAVVRGPEGLPGQTARPGETRARPNAPYLLPHALSPAFQIQKMFPPVTGKCPNRR